jgi:lipopolysaccharide transport system permease protein
MKIKKIRLIKAGAKQADYWQDIWRYRELLYLLAWRDLTLRYKQTMFGVIWVILRPLLTTLVFTVVFSSIAKLPSNNLPYPIMIFTGMIIWQFFADTLIRCSTSLVNNSHLISKVYFPRLILPISSFLVSLVDFMILIGFLSVLLLFYKIYPNWTILTLPIFLLITAIAAIGFGLWISSLNVRYRDFHYLLSFFMQFWLYISPVGFISSVVPEQWRLIYYLNPMAGIIDGFRWSIFNESLPIYLQGFSISLSVIFMFIVSGIWFFRRSEKSFADII